MHFIRDIRIEIAFIVFSIIISSAFSLEIEVFNKAKNISEKHDLFEYIEKGKITMLENSRRCKIEKKAILVLGLTGTGKTTLINYLNGVPLVGMKKGRSWRVNLKNESHTLPCGFEIGHNAHSQTHLPSAYTPPGSDFSYLDNPGFKDTGGLEYGIANAFFRNEITENIDEFKFLLLVTPNGLDERGQQFRDSMEGFSEFLEVFDSEKAEGLSRSIGIVVARVENKIGESDEEVKEGLRDQLLEILNDIKNSLQKRLSDCGSDTKCQWQIKNRELVFRRVIEDSQVEIFSSPTSNATLDDTQKNQILKMIDSLQYVKKNDTVANKTLGFRVVVNKEFIVKALAYTSGQFTLLKNFLEDTNRKVLIEFYTKMKDRLIGTSDAALLYRQLKGIREEGDILCDLDTFIGISDENHSCADGEYKFAQLTNRYKNETVSKVKALKFLISLLPEQNRGEFNFQQRWLPDGTGQNSTISNLIDKLASYLKRSYAAFRKDSQSTLLSSISVYYRRAIEAANNTDDITKIEDAIDGLLKNMGKNDYLFIVQMNSTILEHEKTKAILNEKTNFDPFVTELGLESLLTGYDVFVFVNKLKSEIKTYFESETIETFGEKFILKGYFLRISSIIEKIKKDEMITSLERIQVFAINSFTFDVDFVIDESKYSTNAPHLIVVSPKVFVPKHVTVDLTCRRIPEKINGKAANGVRWSLDGKDGKAGLPGYNGGSFVVYADYIVGRSNLSVISDEGEGGAGQDGGDGMNGPDGRDATRNEINENNFQESQYRYKKKINEDRKLFEHRYTVTILDDYYHFYGEDGKDGIPGGNGGKAGCGGESGYSGQNVMIAHQSRINENKESSSTKNQGIRGESGQVGSGGRKGATAMIRKGTMIETTWRIRGKRSSWRFVNENHAIYQRKREFMLTLGTPSIVKLTSVRSTTANYYFTVPSNTYAASGIKPHECSRLDYKPSIPQILAIYQLETEYLKFTNDQSSKLVHSDLMNRPFLYHIMNGTSEKPSLHQLIERVEVLIPNEPLEYVGGNEILLRKMLPAIDSYSVKTETEQLVVNFTRAAVLSAIYRHKAAQQTNIVVDLQSFLEQSISLSNKQQSVSDKWEYLTESLASQVQRNKSIVEYTKSYESRIKQANEILVELQGDIELNHVDMIGNIEKLLTEIQELKNKKQVEADELNRKKRELQESLKKEKTLGILKFFTALATVVTTAVVAVVAPAAAPFVGMISAGVTTGLDFAENTPAVSINPGDRQWANALAFDLQRSQLCNRNLTSDLSKSERTKRSHKEKMTKIETGQKIQKTFADMVNPPLRSALDIYKKDKAGKDKVKLIEEAIGNIRTDMHNLDRAKDQISCNGEIIDAMFTNISDMVRNQSDQSGVYLRMSKYKLKRIIDDSKAEMFQLLKYFESQGQVDTTFKRLENAILAINDVYGLSEAYNDQIKLAFYIADITKPTVHIPAEYELQVASLKKKILASVISQKYEQARRAFGFRSFPFFCVYDKRVKASANSLQTEVKDKLETLLELVKQDKNTINPDTDSYELTNEFDKGSSFYRWSSREHSSEIRRLLSGEEVLLYADVNKANHDVIKLKNLFLLVEAINSSDNKTLNELLKHFWVRLVYSGKSEFRLKGEIYSFDTHFNDESELILKWAYGCKFVCAKSNKSYQKLTENTPFLSPYTLWKMQLLPQHIKGEELSDAFKEIGSLFKKNQVDVSLGGTGQYIWEDKKKELDMSCDGGPRPYRNF